MSASIQPPNFRSIGPIGLLLRRRRPSEHGVERRSGCLVIVAGRVMTEPVLHLAVLHECPLLHDGKMNVFQQSKPCGVRRPPLLDESGENKFLSGPRCVSSEWRQGLKQSGIRWIGLTEDAPQ